MLHKLLILSLVSIYLAFVKSENSKDSQIDEHQIKEPILTVYCFNYLNNTGSYKLTTYFEDISNGFQKFEIFGQCQSGKFIQ